MLEANSNEKYFESEELQESLNQIFKSPDAVTRRKAVERLGGSDNNKIVELLLTALNDEDSDVREAAVYRLGNFGDKRAVKPLTQILIDTTEQNDIRQMSAEALGKLEDAQAIEPLIEVLKQTDKVYLRDMDGQTVSSEAARALGKLGDGALSPLLSLLKDTNSRRRYNAASALSHLGDPKAFLDLLAALDDENDEVLARVVIALGKAGGKQALQPLIDTLFNSNPIVQKHAILAIGKLGVVEPIIQILENKNEDQDVRASAAFALGNFGNAQAYKPLLSVLNENNSHLVDEAVRALGKIGDAQILPALTELLAFVSSERQDVSWNKLKRTIAKAVEQIRQRHKVG